MKFAVIAPVAAGVTADPRWMSAFAQHVEACGFESIVVVEHTVLMTQYTSVYPYDVSGRVELPADCIVPDPLDLLAFLAGRTERLGLATGVLVLPIIIRSCWPSASRPWMRCPVGGFDSASERAGSRKRSRHAAPTSQSVAAAPTNSLR